MDTYSRHQLPPGYQPDLNGVLVWNPQPAEEETVLWEGPVSQQYAIGSGRLTWHWQSKPVALYEGNMLAGRPHGNGTYRFADGDRYEGEWHEGLRHVYGKQWYHDGRYYEGLWESDRPAAAF